MGKIIQIPEWQFKHIENALRLTYRINKCASKETAFDREVVKAYDFATAALANAETSENSLHKHFVIASGKSRRIPLFAWIAGIASVAGLIYALCHLL
jgi:hypothetical protein